MIVFYAAAGWQLDLTGTSITLIEENALFFDYFIKDRSLPVTSNIEKFTADELRFLDLDNVQLKATRYFGQLLIDKDHKPAYLTIQRVKGKKIKHTIYYGSTIIPLLETRLKDLLFPIVDVSTLTSHANSIISKKYPETDYNFPMIIDEDFKEAQNYEKFQGIINKYVGSSFVTNSTQLEDGETVVYNNNVVTPFPYLMTVLRAGAASAELLLNGDFINDAINEKIIWDTGKFIERFSTSFEDSHKFSYATDTYIENDVVVSEFSTNFVISVTGTYKMKLYLKLPSSIEVLQFVIKRNGEDIFVNNSGTVNEDLEINVSDSSMFGNIQVLLKTKQTDQNIFIYNQFDIETSGDKLNVFPKTFSLADVLPDWTFGKFLNKLRSFLRLKVVLDENILRLDYIDKVLEETDFDNKNAYKIDEPQKETSKVLLYKLAYNDDQFLYVDSNGQAFNPQDYSKSEIEPINLGVRVLPIGELDGIFTAKRIGDSEFNLLLYDGLQSNIPVAVESVQGRSFKLDEVFELRHKPWLLFLLNAIRYTESFDADASEKFDILKGQFKYNAKHIYKVIKRKRKSETTWTYTIESLTIN